MEQFGYLTFVGDLQEVSTQNAQYAGEPFYVRDICIHYFVPTMRDGQLEPYLRGLMMRLTGRTAQTFAIEPGVPVAVEYGSNARPYFDKERQLLRSAGNLNVQRIVEVKDDDLNAIGKLIGGYKLLCS